MTYGYVYEIRFQGNEGQTYGPRPHDWEADPRPLSDCLKLWQVALNGGREYGARPVGQRALRIRSAATYAGLLAGRPTRYEPTIRGFMTLIDLTRGSTG